MCINIPNLDGANKHMTRLKTVNGITTNTEWTQLMTHINYKDVQSTRQIRGHTNLRNSPLGVIDVANVLIIPFHISCPWIIRADIVQVTLQLHERDMQRVVFDRTHNDMTIQNTT